MKKSYVKILAVGFAMAFCALAGNAEARVTGLCSNCHTMHNSQDGGTPVGLDATPDNNLAKGDCVGCHSDSVQSQIKAGNIPVVYKTGVAPANYLAGGNFYWTMTSSPKGHNVSSITGMPADLATPPGWRANIAPAGGTAVPDSWGAGKLTCAGTYGCHGDHAVGLTDFTAISGGHHGDDSTMDGSSVVKSFRFLLGVTGKEDPDWEATTGVGNHNFYKGKARSDDADAQTDNSTISYLCAECHSNFHGGADLVAAADDWNTLGTASPWLRHPSDFDLNKARQVAGGDDYDGYTYSVAVPVATADPAAAKLTGDDSKLSANVAGQAIVMCLSCHRAHGSEFNDILRWDYSTISAGGGSSTTGCFKCHTTKDGVV